MSKQRYIVVNAHWGDKSAKRYRYAKGEVRMIDPDNPEPEVKGHLQFGNLVLDEAKDTSSQKADGKGETKA